MNNVHFKAMAVLGCDLADVRRRGACKHNCCDGENCLIWLDKQFGRLMKYDESGLSPEQVQELVKAKAEERLVVLPCKVGDVVYYLTGRNVVGGSRPDFDRVEESQAQAFYMNADGLSIQLRYDWVGNHGTYGLFGKTVFLTEMEAKEVLKCQK